MPEFTEFAEFLRTIEFPAYYTNYEWGHYEPSFEYEPARQPRMRWAPPIQAWPIAYNIVKDVSVVFKEGEKIYQITIKCLGPNSIRFKNSLDKSTYILLKDNCKSEGFNAVFCTEDGQILEEVKK